RRDGPRAPPLRRHLARRHLGASPLRPALCLPVARRSLAPPRRALCAERRRARRGAGAHLLPDQAAAAAAPDPDRRGGRLRRQRRTVPADDLRRHRADRDADERRGDAVERRRPAHPRHLRHPAGGAAAPLLQPRPPRPGPPLPPPAGDGVTRGLTLAGVALAIGGRALVTGLDLEAAPGEVVTVMGGSGAGKSTLL